MENNNAADYLTVLQHKETLLYHGAYYRYKPTPSGCDRWILWTSTTQGYSDELTAALEIEKAYPHLEKISTKLQTTQPKDDARQ